MSSEATKTTLLQQSSHAPGRMFTPAFTKSPALPKRRCKISTKFDERVPCIQHPLNLSKETRSTVVMLNEPCKAVDIMNSVGAQPPPGEPPNRRLLVVKCPQKSQTGLHSLD